MQRQEKISRRALVKGAACTLAGAVALPGRRAALAQAGAEGWPNRPIRFIVPLAPGGGLDFVARVIADTVSRGLGQQVVIENRTGAGGTIGIETAIKSAPDGYSVLISNDNVAAAPHVLGLNVNYLKDLIPVSLLSKQPLALAVHPTLGVSSLDDL